MNAFAWVMGIIGFLFFNYFIGPKINAVIDVFFQTIGVI